MKFIKLTSRDNKSVYVNMNKIVEMIRINIIVTNLILCFIQVICLLLQEPVLKVRIF